VGMLVVIANGKRIRLGFVQVHPDLVLAEPLPLIQDQLGIQVELNSIIVVKGQRIPAGSRRSARLP
jgi:hypothetical protein